MHRAELRNLTLRYIIQESFIITCSDKKSSMDNPTIDESISVATTTIRIVSNEEDERLFLNPLYSDVGHCSANNSYHPYEDTPVSASYENVYGSGALSYNY